MNVLVTVVSTCIAFYLIDKIFLWLEEKGLLYYRNRKLEGGFASNALLELHTLLNPSTLHIIHAKKNELNKKTVKLVLLAA
jgi:hypothetical protein